MHVHWLMSTGMLFKVLSANHVNPSLVKWHQKLYGSNLAVGPDMAPIVSTPLSWPCSGILGLCEYIWINEFMKTSSITGENQPISTCQVSNR